VNGYVASHIKVVVFDFDDTLIGTYEAIRRLHKHIAKNYYKVNLSDEVILKHWGQPISELAKHYYRADDIEAAIAKMILHQPDFPKEVFPLAAPTIRRLKRAGMLLGIVSAIILPILERDARLTRLPLDLIDYIQTAENTDHHKPNPKVFEPLLNWATARAISADEILYIGDGLQDMEAAHGAGIHFLGVQTGPVSAEAFAAKGARSIADLSRLRISGR
jgi:phosphoglycolate phosphatase-like HAD superfamily hydrolase